MTAFSHFYNSQRSLATPAAAKMLRPRAEPKSTISGWTLEIIFFWHNFPLLKNCISFNTRKKNARFAKIPQGLCQEKITEVITRRYIYHSTQNYFKARFFPGWKNASKHPECTVFSSSWPKNCARTSANSSYRSCGLCPEAGEVGFGDWSCSADRKVEYGLKLFWSWTIQTNDQRTAHRNCQ